MLTLHHSIKVFLASVLCLPLFYFLQPFVTVTSSLEDSTVHKISWLSIHTTVGHNMIPLPSILFGYGEYLICKLLYCNLSQEL